MSRRNYKYSAVAALIWQVIETFCHIRHIIYTVCEGSVCHTLMPMWAEFGMNILGNF